MNLLRLTGSSISLPPQGYGYAGSPTQSSDVEVISEMLGHGLLYESGAMFFRAMLSQTLPARFAFGINNRSA